MSPLAVLLLRLPKKPYFPPAPDVGLLPKSEAPAEGPQEPVGPVGALLSHHGACLSSGTRPPGLGRSLCCLSSSTPACPLTHSTRLGWQVLPEVTSAPSGDRTAAAAAAMAASFAPSPTPPPHQPSGHVPVSRRDWQPPRVSAAEVAGNSTSLVAAAALGHPASQSSLVPVTRAATSGEISIQTEDRKASGQPPPVFSGS